MLQVQNLCKAFGGVMATRDVSIDFPAGSLTALIGPNGAGKTTFFNQVTGYVRPDSGRILFEGYDLARMSSLAITRLGLARAFQVAALFPSLTAQDALAAAVTAHRRRSWQVLAHFPGASARERADELLDLLGLAGKADVLSSTLSHGDQKLLDIGLALALDPKILLLDEPTAGMGPEERWQMIATVEALWKRQRLTIVFIEHDMDVVFKIAQRVHVLRYGALLAQGTPDEIRRNPEVIDAYLGTEHDASGGQG